ncbi:MAG: SNF2-related protein [Polyangiales bacterium]
MSVDPASDDPWIDRVTLQNLLPLCPPESLGAALEHGFSYASPPVVDGPFAVRATFVNNVAPGPAWRGLRVSQPKVVSTRAELVVSARRLLSVSLSCACGRPAASCPHGLALLVDLAVSPALRRAVLHGGVTPEVLDALPAARVSARGEFSVARLVDAWMQLSPRGDAVAWELLLTVVDGGRGGREGVASLELRLRDPATGALLNPLRPKGLTDAEVSLLALGEPLSRGRLGYGFVGARAAVLLRLLRDDGRPVVLEGGEVARFASAPAALRIERARVPRAEVAVGAELSTAAAVEALVARWSAEGDAGFDLGAAEVVLFVGPSPQVFVPARSAFYPVARGVDQGVALSMHQRPAMLLPEGRAADAYARLADVVSGRSVALPPPERMGLGPRETPEVVVLLEGTALDVTARAEARYSFGARALGVAPDPEERVRRDLAREESARARIEAAGMRSQAGVWRAEGDEAAALWSRGLAMLRGAEPFAMTVRVSDALRGVAVRAPTRGAVRVALRGNLLDATAVFRTDDDTLVDIARIREALAKKRRWVALDDGTLTEIRGEVRALLEELDEGTRDHEDRDGAAQATMPVHQLGRVSRWVDLGLDARLDDALTALRGRLRAQAVSDDALVPQGLQTTLRPYQRQGLAWLQFLHALGAGGVLADDMGLGKTVVTLALLLWRKERDGAAPSLVVAPTSVAGNWVREAARFAPALRVLLLHGPKRAREAEEIAAADVVVTTYALLRRDLPLLQGVRFRTVVLDEAQQVKNAGAQSTQAARALDAESRVALTGTPVENRLGELWSIMDLCNPGMLGSARSFASKYERAIIAQPGGEAAERLRALVRPFVLRRTKREVLTDLPPREDIDVACTPGGRQRKLYDALSTMVRAEVDTKVRAVGLARSGITVLTALLRLRQMACDPRLVDPSQPAALSAKRQRFLELVSALVEEGRRVLVFSQFVELLTLWREDLDAQGVAYEYLDGRTKDRDGAVARFQEGTAPLFLISLKAGGTGLNLTAADTVIHCDPWWNPAVEEQASDRAHRIGQTRAVTVYRLIARGTVEERIEELKRRKRALADAVVSADAGALRGLSEEDITLLLGAAETPLDEVLSEG